MSVVESCQQATGSVHRGFICIAFGSVHKDKIFELSSSTILLKGIKIKACNFLSQSTKIFSIIFFLGNAHISVIFRKLIVCVTGINFEGAERPRRSYQLGVHKFSKCFVSWANQKHGNESVSFQHFKNDIFMIICSPFPKIPQNWCVKF